MVTTVQMDDGRNVVCNVNLTATYKFASFHALVRLEYVSETGHLLGLSENWEHDCGPAPFNGAAHAKGPFFETAPAGTHEIRVVQIAQYSLDFSNLVGPIGWILKQIGAAGNGPYQVPTDPGNPEDTQVEPPDWYSVAELKGRVSVTSGFAQ